MQKHNTIQIGRIATAFVFSVAITSVLASFFQSLFVLSALEKAGADIPIAMWLHTIWHDLYGLIFAGYLPFGLTVFIGFLVAFPSAALAHKFTGLPSWLLYPLAGAGALMVIRHVVIFAFVDLNILVGTRGAAGYGFLLLAGVLGGAFFAANYNR